MYLEPTPIRGLFYLPGAQNLLTYYVYAPVLRAVRVPTGCANDTLVG